MKQAIAIVLLVACTQAGAAPPSSSGEMEPHRQPPALDVHFSPHGGCQDAVVALIASAKHSVHLSAYGFTSQPIAVALAEQARNGVEVALVLDRSDGSAGATANTRRAVELVRGAHGAVYVDSQHPIMHDKYVIVDGTTVETGSYNFTVQAERGNAENCLVIRAAALAAQYDEDWRTHRDHSRRM